MYGIEEKSFILFIFDSKKSFTSNKLETRFKRFNFSLNDEKIKLIK
jgi:hypothetical protein